MVEGLSQDDNTPSAAAAGTVTIGGDLVVNRLGFGAMRLPGPGVWGEPSDRERARAVVRRAVELGVTLIDTADYYGAGVANRLIAEALYPYPDGLVLVTKFGARRSADAAWHPAAAPEQLRAACEDNLRHLRLERLDVVHFRYVDGSGVPLAESLGTMARLREEGKVRHVGVSNVSFAQFQEAQTIVPVASVQNLYSVTSRDGEEVLDACTAQSIPFMPYFPLAIGRVTTDHAALATVARRRAATPAQVALAWLLTRSPMIAPIPGTSSPAHVEENVAAAGLRLTEADLADLTA